MNFFAHPFFKYQNSILTNLEILGAIFLLIPFELLKKDTYES